MIKNNTILGIDLFNESFDESLIFHIPHSSYYIPLEYRKDFISEDLIESENNKLVDHATDRIFNTNKGQTHTFKYSRIFCDVERLNDEDEPMFKFGRGICYTKTDDGEILRILDDKTKKEIYENFYLKHHNIFNEMVENNLNNMGFATIIDCHSYSDEPFKTDLIKESNRPDFCLGVDEFHTPKWLVDLIFNGLIKYEFSVEINNPYQGTIVPLKYYNKNGNVFSIMIEVNRKLYMENGNVITSKLNDLNELINEILNYGRN